jgi:hypothetical protein
MPLAGRINLNRRSKAPKGLTEGLKRAGLEPDVDMTFSNEGGEIC